MWTRHTAPDGRPYYYNAVLKKSSWTQPAEFPGGPQAGSDRPTWEQHRAPDGRVYFFNRETKQSKWTRPEGVMIVNKAGADAGGYLGAPGTHENATKVRAMRTGIDAWCCWVGGRHRAIFSPNASVSTAEPQSHGQ